MHKIVEELINNGIGDALITNFIIGDFCHHVKIEYRYGENIIQCSFEECFEVNFTHDINDSDLRHIPQYYIQGIDILEENNLYYVAISAWPFDGKIVCRNIEIKNLNNRLN